MATVSAFPLETVVAAKTHVGLGNVDNTADANKPVSAAQQSAIDAKVQNSLTASTTVAPSATAVNTALALKADASAVTGLVQNNLTASTTSAPSATAVNNALALKADSSAVTGLVQNNLNASTTVAPSATAVNTALALKADASALTAKADLASPALTGTPTAPTAAGGTNTTQLATTAFVGTAVSTKANAANAALTGTPTAPTATAGTNTTQIATTAFVTTAVATKADTSALAAKADLASPALTGTPTAPTAAGGTNTTQIATTAFVTAAIGAGGGGSVVDSMAGTETTSAPSVSSVKTYINSADALKANAANPVFTGVATIPGAIVTAPVNTSGNVIQVAVGENQTLAVNADTTFTFGGTPVAGQQFNWTVTNAGATIRTITIPSSISLAQNAAITSFKLLPNARLKIAFIYDGTSYWIIGETQALNNFTATVDPTVTDDNTKGYALGSQWVNTAGSKWFVLTNATTGAAVWIQPNSASATVADGSITMAKLANIATATVIGRTAAGTGVPSAINLSDLPVSTATTSAISAAQTAAQNAAFAADSLTTINAQTGTAYTLVLADGGRQVDMNNAAANTVTIPANATVAFPVGTVVTVCMVGAGATTIAPVDGTVTIVKPTARTLTISAQYETAVLHKVATNTWRVLAS